MQSAYHTPGKGQQQHNISDAWYPDQPEASANSTSKQHFVLFLE